MMEGLTKVFQEISQNEGLKGSNEIPTFAKDLKAETTISNYEEANQPIRYVETRNKSLEGDVHPISGVPFHEKTVDLSSGETVEGVFPEFPSSFDHQLEDSQYLESDARQFKSANEALTNEVERNPDLAKQFTPEQLEQIAHGETPDGYVWHHSEEPGKLQLVDKELHDMTGHTGGRSLWGGGSDFR